MKKKYYFFAAALLIAMSVNAQETYQNAKLTTQDLNGTARYIGMGGALEALVQMSLLSAATLLV